MAELIHFQALEEGVLPSGRSLLVGNFLLLRGHFLEFVRNDLVYGLFSIYIILRITICFIRFFALILVIAVILLLFSGS